MAYTQTISLTDIPCSLVLLRQKAIAWAQQFSLVASYTSNDIPYPYHGFDDLIAVSDGEPIKWEQENVFEELQDKHKAKQALWCGYLGYDLKNQIENLSSHNADAVGFPDIFLFEPELYLHFNKSSLIINSKANNIQDSLQQILATPILEDFSVSPLQLQQRVQKEDYIRNVERVRDYIRDGEVYELNYCMEFYAEEVKLSPLPLYLQLNALSPTPFSGFLKNDDLYLLCASPERFLKKEGRKLISQPIKGTIRRGTTPEEDQQLQQQLRHDEKELAENMMIVDLVRNDLRRSCATGTIQVEEMFGIYGFRQVSQMISTISGELHPECMVADALKGLSRWEA
ncbi:para-aminobenzoate synthase subunit I [Pontibacter sp. BAB1700]|nr:para-aminobenzoate synthase subunit I [Pontibacter sp. BAB1700]